MPRIIDGQYKLESTTSPVFHDWQVEGAAKELELQPPLTAFEASAVLGLLNGVKPDGEHEEQVRYDIVMAACLAAEGRPFSDRALVLAGLRRHIGQNCEPLLPIDA